MYPKGIYDNNPTCDIIYMTLKEILWGKGQMIFGVPISLISAVVLTDLSAESGSIEFNERNRCKNGKKSAYLNRGR